MPDDVCNCSILLRIHVLRSRMEQLPRHREATRAGIARVRHGKPRFPYRFKIKLCNYVSEDCIRTII